MKKLYVLGLALLGVLAFSAIGASGASAFTLWDECSKAAPTTEFTNADCNVVGAGGWGWLEITALTTTESLLADVVLINLGFVTVEVLCEGFVDGSVGANGEDEVTELLNELHEPVTSTNPVLCTQIANCPEPLAYPVNLPWSTQLVATGDLLGPSAGHGNPGWHVRCDGTGAENECTREDTILSVENLEAELEVDLTFPEEIATCTNALEKEGLVKGTASIFLKPAAGAEPDRALRAM